VDNWAWDIPTLLMKDPEINSIHCGYHHSIILKNNGELFIFGANNFYQLGLKHTKIISKPTLLMIDPEIKSIHCNYYHSMILKNNGELLIFGRNEYGQLGIEDHNTCYDEPTLSMTNSTINLWEQIQTPILWHHRNHINYSKQFKQRIYTFLLFLKRNQVKTGLKIPKFLLFEIIKFVV